MRKGLFDGKDHFNSFPTKGGDDNLPFCPTAKAIKEKRTKTEMINRTIHV